MSTIELKNPELTQNLKELSELYNVDSDELLTEIIRSGLIAWRLKYMDLEMKGLREKGSKINQQIFRNTPYYKR